MYTPIETASSSDIAVSIKEKEIVSSEDSITLNESFRNMRMTLRAELHIDGINQWEKCVDVSQESAVKLRTKDNQ